MEGEAGQELITKVQFLQKTVFDLVIGVKNNQEKVDKIKSAVNAQSILSHEE